MRLTADRTPDGWSRVADAYDEHVTPLTRAYALDALRIAGVRPGMHVLDVACGPGALTMEARRLGARVTATDFAPAMVDRLRVRLRAEGAGDVRVEVMDGQALALPDDAFDAAFSLFGLIFFPNRAAGLRELRRVVRPAGRAVVVAWSVPERIESFRVVQAAVRETVPDLPPAPERPAILSLSDPARFEREMRDAGFRDVRIEPVVHEWAWPSAEAFWDSQARISPVFQMLLDRLGSANVERVRAAVLNRLRADHGGGSPRLKSEALVGHAVK